MNATLIPVWQQVTPELSAELVAFWHANQALAGEAGAANRAAQAVCIARDQAGEICAVGTAVVRVLPRLRQPMYYYRQFIAKRARGTQLVKLLYLRANNILEDYQATLAQAESLGILLEIENTKLAAIYSHAYEPTSSSTFIGYSPRGLQLRVAYFANAVLLPPAPLPAAMARHAPARRTQNPVGADRPVAVSGSN